MPKVVFEPDGVEREVLAGTSVVEAAARAGIVLRTACGRRGLCGKCRVRFLSGAPRPTAREAEALGERELKQGHRLACASLIARDARVCVPEESRLYRQCILEEGRKATTTLDPRVRVHEVRMPAPDLDDQRSDYSRLLDALGGREEFRAGVEFLRRLPGELRREGFELEVVECGGELLDARPGGAPVLGAAVDIGTTTVVGAVYDLRTGALLGRSSATNPQGAFGDDVVLRMDHARAPGGLAELQEAISGCIDGILRSCCAAGGAETDHLYEIVVAGNTVMTLLCFGIDPVPVATIPFAPATLGPVSAEAREAGLAAAPRARVWSVPCVSGYVGGDIVAGFVASGAGEREGVSLYIDIGTNGEIVLRSQGKTYACSTAAGPAFEGARISCGMRAEAGAIDHVELRDSKLVFTTIDSAPARGICGTGLVDLAACLLNSGVVDASGAFQKTGPAAKKLKGDKFVVSARRGSEVSLTQRDVRELQLAKGAILAGTRILAERAGVEPGEIDRVLLAGAFGNYIDPANALALGLLPPELPVERIEFVGNAALAGACAALLDSGYRRKMEETARSIEYVELSAEREFQDRFAEAMFFPEIS